MEQHHWWGQNLITIICLLVSLKLPIIVWLGFVFLYIALLTCFILNKILKFKNPNYWYADLLIVVKSFLEQFMWEWICDSLGRETWILSFFVPHPISSPNLLDFPLQIPKSLPSCIISKDPRSIFTNFKTQLDPSSPLSSSRFVKRIRYAYCYRISVSYSVV